MKEDGDRTETEADVLRIPEKSIHYLSSHCDQTPDINKGKQVSLVLDLVGSFHHGGEGLIKLNNSLCGRTVNRERD